ncbi:MAG: SIR2 family protein, partial [Microlunatus sp.]|nr:SIR2 family protein [Microlunatus sp.]
MTETESSDRGLSSYLDPVLTLAQTMHATSSAYAILLGAGVSIAAGVPSAWGVVENLSSRLAAQEHQDAGDDPAGWFCTRYGHDPRYEELLESLAPTQLERQRILAQFFEPSPGSVDGEPSRGQPSLAHRSVARLAAAGHLRVILTLNFDRLTETALREIGIEPTVVASVEDLAGLAPLHTLQALVVHLHGDYLSATTMLNTTTELGTYPATVNQFLDQVLTDYGLLIVGWSGAYDE